MPHASLTPLGRQLRSVLANLRPKLPDPPPSQVIAPRANHQDSTSRGPILFENAPTQSRTYHAFRALQSATVVAAVSEPAEELDIYQPLKIKRVSVQRPEERRRLGRKSLNRQTRVDRLTEALQNAEYSDVAASTPKWKVDISHADVRSHGTGRRYLVNARSRRQDLISDLAQSRRNTLDAILASFIRHQAATAHTGHAEWTATFSLPPAQARLLDSKGYDLHDVEIWAKIVSSLDSLEAAEALERHTDPLAPRVVPLFVLLYLLRRPYISQRALRIIIQQTWKTLSYHFTKAGAAHIPMDTTFLLFIRLVRHAREVWPRCLESLSELLLEFLPKSRFATTDVSMEELQVLTYMLNKAMRLLAVPTAFEPFKNNYLQEAAIVTILRFMAEHDPPLQTNREGYRAVILLQLAQRKRPNEEQWAELKALSWPPWKEDRTAMDADITLEEHGMSKAAETLQRMQEAGYAPLRWEKTASIYTGWDVDRTPTIQTQVLLGTGGFRFTTEAAKWAARITATRTAQEAWACFLAYEEKKLAPNQDVYLAIFRKLYKEEQRQRLLKTGEIRQSQDTVYAGDAQEVSPLPPSTHLYTYTRIPPPTVDDFYRHLRERGVVFEAHCLAFLVAHADSLQHGIEYLIDSATRHPQNLCLLHPKESGELSEIPIPIFQAFIALLSRLPTTSFPSEFSASASDEQFHPVIQDFHSPNHSIARAVELLARRRPTGRSSWNAVLQSLSKPALSRTITNVQRAQYAPMDPMFLDKYEPAGAFIAYKIVRRVHRMMRKVYISLDPIGFQALCWSVENLALGFLSILRYEEQNSHSGDRNRTPMYLARVAQLIKSGPTSRLSTEFRLLNGDSDLDQQGPENQEEARADLRVPQLLELPSPAILHSYIRALGWMADYEELRDTVQWMVRNRHELLLRCKRDRNGVAMMGRTLVAARVFLERSWLAAAGGEGRELIEEQGLAGDTRQRLRRLEIPASKGLINEVRALVESVEEWGGWPDAEEVEDYCTHGRFASR